MKWRRDALFGGSALAPSCCSHGARLSPCDAQSIRKLKIVALVAVSAFVVSALFSTPAQTQTIIPISVQATSATPASSASTAWGVYADMAGTHWKGSDGTIYHYEWKIPGEVLSTHSINRDGEDYGTLSLAPSGRALVSDNGTVYEGTRPRVMQYTSKEWKGVLKRSGDILLNEASKLENGHWGVVKIFERTKIKADEAASALAHAYFRLGLNYERGRSVQKDFSKAEHYYKNGAKLGSSNALVNLGLMHDTGLGAVKDKARAAEFYRKAADKGNPLGFYNLARLYRTGEGVAKNIAEAVSLYRRAADLGEVDAMNYLAFMFEKGQEVRKDMGQAVFLYRRAADLGHIGAMTRLAYIYLIGKEVRKDTATAAQLYRRAAEAGDAIGMFNLGTMLASGEGVSQDLPEAVRWYRRAAEKGNTDAMINLGIHYRHGRGVAEDHAEARRLFSVAAAKGDATAQANLDDMTKPGSSGGGGFLRVLTGAIAGAQGMVDAGGGVNEALAGASIGIIGTAMGADPNSVADSVYEGATSINQQNAAARQDIQNELDGRLAQIERQRQADERAAASSSTGSQPSPSPSASYAPAQQSVPAAAPAPAPAAAQPGKRLLLYCIVYGGADRKTTYASQVGSGDESVVANQANKAAPGFADFLRASGYSIAGLPSCYSEETQADLNDFIAFTKRTHGNNPWVDVGYTPSIPGR